MNIGVDIRSLLTMSRGGIPHYAFSLLRELVSQHPQDRWQLLQTGRQPYRLPKELTASHVHVHHLRRPNRLMNAQLAATGHPKLDTAVGGVDVWFSPGFGFTPLSNEVPSVLTVHDLSFRIHPEWYDWKSRWWHWAVRPKFQSRRATRLIAVSRQTEQELETEYGIPAERIAVIHPGIDAAFSREISSTARACVRKKYDLPDFYVICAGAAEPRKNLTGLLEAYQDARSKGLTSELVLIGRGTERWNGPEQLLSGVRRLGFVDDGDVPALYAEARLLAHVSRYEGFGFPPLEALAAGTPSLVSDLPIFRETLGPAALRTNPDNPGAMADSLVQLDGDEQLRQRLVRESAERLPEFDWTRAAQGTYRVLIEAANAR